MIPWLVLLQATLTIATAGPATAPEYLPLRVAQAEGYFAQEQLTVSLETTRNEATAAETLGRGQTELAATSLDAALQLGHSNGTPPKLVFGLTAAPPVALLVPTAHEDAVRSLDDLVGRTIGVPAPGTPAEFALFAVLGRAGLRISQVTEKSFGDLGLARAIGSGAVTAGILGDPYASRLIDDARAVALVDLRKRGEPARWLGEPTVHAAIFARAEAEPGTAQLESLARALLKAVARIQAASPEELQAKLPPPTVGSPEDFRARFLGVREVFLHDGLVTPEMLKASVALVTNRSPIPVKVTLPRPLEKLLLTEPLEKVLESRRP